jgi:hypothetical protein
MGFSPRGQFDPESQVQSMQRSLTVLSLGIIIGLVAASAYYKGTQQRSKFLFDQNARCQQIAKQYESENRVAVLKVGYSTSRNSCVAEIAKPPKDGSIDLTVGDLLTGEQLFFGRCTVAEFTSNDNEKFGALGKEQDAKFAQFVP